MKKCWTVESECGIFIDKRLTFKWCFYGFFILSLNHQTMVPVQMTRHILSISHMSILIMKYNVADCVTFLWITFICLNITFYSSNWIKLHLEFHLYLSAFILSNVTLYPHVLHFICWIGLNYTSSVESLLILAFGIFTKRSQTDTAKPCLRTGIRIAGCKCVGDEPHLSINAKIWLLSDSGAQIKDWRQNRCK